VVLVLPFAVASRTAIVCCRTVLGLQAHGGQARAFIQECSTV
jgi:hypothetical protein